MIAYMQTWSIFKVRPSVAVRGLLLHMMCVHLQNISKTNELINLIFGGGLPSNPGMKKFPRAKGPRGM